jgi:hypothetical protein
MVIRIDLLEALLLRDVVTLSFFVRLALQNLRWGG